MLHADGQLTVSQRLNAYNKLGLGDLAYIAEDAMKEAKENKPQAAVATVGGN